MKIIKVESITKKRLREKALIKEGKDVDLAVNKDWLSNRSSKLEAFEFEALTVHGKEYTKMRQPYIFLIACLGGKRVAIYPVVTVALSNSEGNDTNQEFRVKSH